ncbi:TetR/AcrR family transcriptional regulator C-terminal domain-containing protein [Kitasatospora sp. NBC_01250]|uniref:TetR/AcrR family transcriptional regulator C-terminal domain-containing protein n=1 Tax=Kitasatospora sp. NBC_01250 TaxID=2903571 RepID=UPI002E2FBC5B|nr:TetR/AcrR family transcriptional regulator C-terminal domain-containing protein [Kitasatospora sp. NBC_01250]
MQAAQLADDGGQCGADDHGVEHRQARTVDLYARGATHSEIVVQELMQSQNWNNGDELRVGLAPQMRWLMATGRYPVLERHLVEARRKDDPQWQFELGLDCVLDGIAARLAKSC